MKKFLAVLSLVVVSSLMAGFVYAGSEVEMRISVPFDFCIQDQMFPAGQYRFEMVPGSLAAASRVIVREADGKGVMMLETLPGLDARPTKSSLSFHKYGDRYFLSSVSILKNKATIRMTKLEKELRSQIEQDRQNTIMASN